MVEMPYTCQIKMRTRIQKGGTYCIVSKPKWCEAPDWATYLAMDEDGTWHWFEYEPVIRWGKWWQTREGKQLVAYAIEYVYNESLSIREGKTHG